MRATNKYLKLFFPVVDVIARNFGSNCEVVLHDFSKPHASIIKIANGHITGRDVGGPATDLILSLLESDGPSRDCIIGYKTKTEKGGDLRSSTVMIRDPYNKLIGALCINVDITGYIYVKRWIESFLSDVLCHIDGNENSHKEKFAAHVDDLVNEMIENSMQLVTKPIEHMNKEDKLKIVKDLKKRGLFLIKGSAKKVSNDLNISLSTIYKYFEELGDENFE
jgi:predicted transcriptional regulator YheO